MAQTPQVRVKLVLADEDGAAEQLKQLAGSAKAETKRLGAQTRRLARSLAQLEAACAKLGIKFDNPDEKE